jgi:hypothetical protein
MAVLEGISWSKPWPSERRIPHAVAEIIEVYRPPLVLENTYCPCPCIASRC